MKKGWKAGWIIAGVAAVTGGMFCIAGVALGGRADTIEFNGEHVFDFFSGELFEDDLSEVASPYGAPEEQYTGSERENLFTDVKRMEVEMSVGEIIVEETDGAEIQVTIPEDFRKIQCYQDGEKLTIENTERKSKLGKSVEPVVIGIPKGYRLESFQCEIAAGEFTADKLRGGYVEISAGVGDVTIEKVDATTMTLEAGAGEIDIMEAGVSEGEIECGMGEIYLTLAGEETDYECFTECGMGSVWIGDEEYTALGSEKRIHPGAEKKLAIECGAGEITIDFSEQE